MKGKWQRNMIRLSPPQLLAAGFMLMILIGGLLLKLPAAGTEHVSWIDAFFTAVSATTVTGLGTVDIGSTFSLFGEIIIMVLVQLGGLGLMTFAVMALIMLGRKIGLKQRLLVQEAFNQTSIGGIIRLVRTLFLFSIIIEGIAFLLLSERWVPEYGWSKGMYYSLFHTVTAFNNAGFSLWPDNLARYVGDPVVNIVISGLFIIGGLGFTVLIDLWRKRDFRSLTLHTKLMLVGTFIINLSAMGLIFVMEYGNQRSFGGLSLHEQLFGSLFQAVSPRTAGFLTIPTSDLTVSSILLIMVLMFIGAGSASTGSGIKLTTFIVVLLTTISFLKGKDEVVIFRRTIRKATILRSLAIIVVSLLFVLVSLFLLTMTENKPFLSLLFEVLSAFGTVGLTLDLTPHLTTPGKIIIMGLMFIGRVGPLAFAFIFATRKSSAVKYPEEDIFTG
ncbi:TrkH family potassium uptake protein [Aciduricibacillus chroicocephali]|uniref:TrkH family potassium uptake protein n=2 Tax=Aciduricibacillus chroicocephali TaxID=3054939 RepID=A0ABY9KVZ9_9BACI|nr:TrkH family potassium uptake protein [Bacillaceae bacterium 44XB]